MQSKIAKLFVANMLSFTTSCTANSFTSSVQTDTTQTTVTKNEDAQGRKASLLSAFFGLDNALPLGTSLGICRGAGGSDGMPVIFSHEIDTRTLQSGDFKVITASGQIGALICVTMNPAVDMGELRTVLFVGKYGSTEDPPVRVEVTGDLLSKDGSLNFKGASIDVTPLEEGPQIVRAEIVPENEWELSKAVPQEARSTEGSGCPVGTRQVVRVIWAGGVTKPGGDEVDDKERQQYTISIENESGESVTVKPFALGDLGDGDNNHELCLDNMGTPKSVTFTAGFMTDPREDLNPETTINIQS